jgi:nucleoside-diphosphate kinase
MINRFLSIVYSPTTTRGRVDWFILSFAMYNANMDKTFILLKPDALARQLDPVIKAILQQEGILIIDEKTVRVTKDLVLTHYQDVIERVGAHLGERMISALEGQLVIAMHVVAPGMNAIELVRTLIGATDPAKADPKSIRGRYGNDSMEQASLEQRMLYNLIHASDSVESYQRELSLWLQPTT